MEYIFSPCPSSVVDLSEADSTTIKASVEDVAKFKEPTEGHFPIAFASPVLLYAIRSRPNQLRVYNVMNKDPQAPKVSFTEHTMKVDRIAFSSTASPSIIVSSSFDELLCWRVNRDCMSTQVLFKFKDVLVHNFCWMRDEEKKIPAVPSLLISYTKKEVNAVASLSVIDVKNVISKSSTDVPYELKDTDITPLHKNLGTISNSHCFSSAVTNEEGKALTVIAYTPWAVVAIFDEFKSNMLDVFPEGSTEIIEHICVLERTKIVVVAGTYGTLMAFNLSNAPVLVFHASTRSKITGMNQIGKNVIVVCEDLFVYSLQFTGTGVRYAKSMLSEEIRKNFSLYRDAAAISAYVDSGDKICIMNLIKSTAKYSSVEIPLQVPVPLGKPAPVQLVHEDQSTVKAIPNPITNIHSSADTNGSSLLRNPNLSTGTVPAKVAQALDQSKKDTRVVLNNVHASIKAAGNVIRSSGNSQRDVDDLIHIALESQLSQLKSSLRGEGLTSSAKQPVVSDITNEFVEELMRRTSSGIIDGILPAIRRAATEVCEASVNEGIGKGIQASTAKMLKTKIDNSSVDIMKSFNKVLIDHGKTSEPEIERHVISITQKASSQIHRLQQMNQALQTQLDEITNSGVLDQIRKLRREVAELKADRPHGSNVVVNGPSGESIFETAKGLIDEDQVESGLWYIIASNVPSAAIALISYLGEDDMLLEKVMRASVRGSTWSKFITVSASCVKTEAQLISLVDVFTNILDMDHVMDINNGEAKRALLGVAAAWEGITLSDSTAERSLKTLMAL
eukprot:Tbor_TRINITY_DN3857_c0_g1::TRINITY_DN3857_c0_g1_i1::g.5646::m.5646